MACGGWLHPRMQRLPLKDTSMSRSATSSTLHRRQWLQWSAALLAGSAAPWLAAQTSHVPGAALPKDFLAGSKHVTIVVGGPAGGATDGVARVLAQAFSAQLAREVIVDNKPGAGGTIGSKFVSQSKNDGHTLLLGHIGTNVLSPLMQTPMPYDPAKGFTPIGQIGNTASVLLVPAGGPTSLQQALQQWKQQGTFSYASTGIGSNGHLLGHLLAEGVQVKGLHVPYRGSPFALQDLAGGRVDAMFATAGAIGAFIDSKKLVPLAVASGARSSYYPQLPTLREAGFQEVSNEGWFGLFASAHVAEPIASAWHAHLHTALQQPQVIKQLQGLVVDIATSASQKDYAQFIDQEISHWTRVVTQLGDALKAT